MGLIANRIIVKPPRIILHDDRILGRSPGDGGEEEEESMKDNRLLLPNGSFSVNTRSGR